MRMTRIAWAALILLAGAIGWFGAIYAIPSLCSELTWARMLKSGSHINVLRDSRVRFAPGDVVPLDNADTVTRSVIYDLSKGPLLFEADVPTTLKYWSVTVFARNTDTLFVANDQNTGPGKFSLIVRMADQRSSLPVNQQIVSTSTRGFLLVRAIMQDRNDQADVDRTLATVARERAMIVHDDARPR